MALKILPPALHFRRDACAWIICGFCVVVSSVYLLRFKVMETCLFLALFCLCIFVILMALFKSYFLLMSSFFNRIILLEFFFICISIIILFDQHFNHSYFGYYFVVRIVLAFIIRLRFKIVVFLPNLVFAQNILL